MRATVSPGVAAGKGRAPLPFTYANPAAGVVGPACAGMAAFNVTVIRMKPSVRRGCGGSTPGMLAVLTAGPQGGAGGAGGAGQTLCSALE
ncbi:hypothetical protein GCM10017784_14400 [Deinococcus indicus]|nr:hypothetical protein GCM10017784_14400 [Deinococcus indicus]